MSATARSEPADQAPADTLPVDVATIRTTVARALEQGPLPRYEDLADLEALLRGHLQLLLPIADAAVEKLWHGSAAWYGQRSFLSAIRHDLAQGLGPGIMSARQHVITLARNCTALLKYAPQDGTA